MKPPLESVDLGISSSVEAEDKLVPTATRVAYTHLGTGDDEVLGAKPQISTHPLGRRSRGGLAFVRRVDNKARDKVLDGDMLEVDGFVHAVTVSRSIQQGRRQ